MQIQTRTKQDLRNEDQRWLGNGGEPIGRNQSIVLDRSAFTTAFPNGYIPSGLVLGRITATGLYAPYGANANEVQSLIATGATAGTFTLTFDGETTGTIAWNAAASAVQTALEALSNVGPGDITAAGGPLPGTAVTLTFGGQYAGTNVPAITGNSGSLTGGTATITTTTAGGSAASNGTQDAAGLLFAAVPYDRDGAAGDDLGAALFWSGEVLEQYLPSGHGLDAAARTALKHIRFVPAP